MTILTNSSRLTNWIATVRSKGKMLGVVALSLLGAGTAGAQAMSGTYTVCASGCNYTTPQAARNDLATRGVNGPVTIDIKPGIYTTQLSFTAAITGASATNRVTIQGQGRNTLIRSGSITQLVNLQNVRWMTIKDLMIENTGTSSGYYAVYLSNCNDVKFLNCDIKAAYLSTTNYCIYTTNCQYLDFRNNQIRGGYYTLYMTAGNTVGYNKFIDNHITQCYYYVIYHQGHRNDEFIGNYIDSSRYNYGYHNYFTTVEGGGHRFEENVVPMYNGYMTMYWYQYNIASAQPNYIVNNLFGNNDPNNPGYAYYGAYMYCYSASALNINLRMWHNTFANGKGGSQQIGTVYLYNYLGTGVDMRNNNFFATGNSCALSIYQINSGMTIDYNNYWNKNNANSLIYNLSNGTTYSLATWKTYGATAGGQAQNESNMDCKFVSLWDMHYDQTVGSPYGKIITQVLTDIDGDARCIVFPTVGADENPFGKSKSAVNFFAPSTVYAGNPTVIYNVAKLTEPKAHKWYIDGVYQDDSVHLETTKLSGTSHEVKLVTISCQGTDSITKTIFPVQATKAPVTDFIASVNTINQGQEVFFKDLSSNGPASWNWKITPDSSTSGGARVSNFRVTFGGMTEHRVRVRFTEPGLYKVCLTTGNSVGAGNQECKVDYIRVDPTINIGSVATVSYRSGKLYDDGGPNGPYIYSYQNNKKTIIDACADTVYFKINYFDMHCQYDYLQAWEGRDKKGTPLHDCTSNNQYGYGPGWTGQGSNPNCPALCKPDPNKIYKAAGAVMFEQSTVYGNGVAGYEIEWWSTPKKQAKPEAKFEVRDTVCTNEFVNFVNKSTGDEIKYYWDLDGDMSFYESNSSTAATWPYFFSGVYNITLITENCGGFDTFSKAIVVQDPKSPKPLFTADNLNPGSNDVVFFSSEVKECVDIYSWKFTKVHGTGDVDYENGTTFQSANPQVTFLDTGLWTVELEVGNVTGTDNLVKVGYINVKDAYCTPSVATLLPDIGISRVKFHTLNNASNQATTDFTNYARNKALTINVERGVEYEYTVERTSNFNTAARAIFIDWNGDGDFSDAGEDVATETAGKALSWTGKFTIPGTAAIGATTMRVAINQGNYSNKPCGQNEFGEYEDYRLYVSNDITAPEIKLAGMDTIRFEQGGAYTEPGFTATDNLDGDVTANVKITSTPNYNELIANTYVFSYNVSDAAGNKAVTQKRVVIIEQDKTAPMLTVSGPETLFVNVFSPIVPQKVISALDLVDGDITADVTVSPDPASIPNNVVDTTTLNFVVTDFFGNTAVVTRVIIVQDIEEPTVTLRHQADITHRVGTAYLDSGVNVADNYYSEADLRANGLTMISTVNENVVGVYEVRYTLVDRSGNVAFPEAVRTVRVIDDVAPVAELKDKKATVTVEVFNTYNDAGAMAVDNYDGDLDVDAVTGSFYTNFPDGETKKTGSYTIIYSFKDASGNTDTIIRTVNVVDTKAPSMVLNGIATANVCRWASYTDPGYTASDAYDGTNITVVNEGDFVDTDKPGIYSRRYKATDQSGNVAYSQWRLINVLDTRDLLPNGDMCNVNNGVGLADANALSNLVTVYPNPNAGRFNVKVELPASDRVTMVVIDAMGRQVGTVNNGKSVARNVYEVDMTGVSAGVYTLQVTGANYSFAKTIAIQK